MGKKRLSFKDKSSRDDPDTGRRSGRDPRRDARLKAAAAKGMIAARNLLSQREDSLQDKFNKAVRQGDLNTIEECLFDGADAKKPDSQGNTPLHAAAEKGAIVTMRLFMAEEADIDAQNAKGETPLMCAIRGPFGNIEAVKTLLDAGCDITLKNKDGKTALTLANEDPKASRALRHMLRMAQLSHAQRNPVGVNVETAGEIAVRKKPLSIRPHKP